MDSIQNFKARLALLDTMLSKIKTSHARMRQLKRSVHVLRALLKEEGAVKSPYGPATPFIPFSLQ
jgi:hypothetical protein